MLSPTPPTARRRIVICDYNVLLQSVAGLLRMSGYSVFQAYDGWAVIELCRELPDVELLVLNTTGARIDTPTLVRTVRARTPGMPVLHIGNSVPKGLAPDVPTIDECFTPDRLLAAVRALLRGGDPCSPRRPLMAGRPPHILVVDDEGALRTLVVRALRIEYEVTEAGDGDEAWALAQRIPFDLVVTDNRMPGMSGTQLAGRLQTIHPLLPVLHLSGSHGMDEAITPDVPTLFKPFEIDALLAAVRALLPTRPLP